MKATISELRIGNLFMLAPISHSKLPKVPTPINRIDKRGCDKDYIINGFMWDQGSYVGYGLKDIKPIPLTEEWVLKFGFEFVSKQHQYGWFKDVLDRQICWCHSKEISIEFRTGQYDEYQGTLIDVDCEYVHQLQNLYFALTGEELTLKE